MFIRMAHAAAKKVKDVLSAHGEMAPEQYADITKDVLGPDPDQQAPPPGAGEENQSAHIGADAQEAVDET